VETGSPRRYHSPARLTHRIRAVPRRALPAAAARHACIQPLVGRRRKSARQSAVADVLHLSVADGTVPCVVEGDASNVVIEGGEDA
jgi:hypothetical protein